VNSDWSFPALPAMTAFPALFLESDWSFAALEWAFTALIYEMAVADVDDTITASSQVLVMGYYHQSFLFLTDQSSQ
jgi:hypothetical protein